jgi:hypothetical protein
LHRARWPVYDAAAMASKHFTIEEANELLPRLEHELKQLLVAQEQASAAAQELGGLGQAMDVLKRRAVVPGKAKTAEQLVAATHSIIAGVERINALGCLIKDLDLGIIDFPGEHQGVRVNLCWQFGEPQVLHYHGPEEEDEERRQLFETADALLKVH